MMNKRVVLVLLLFSNLLPASARAAPLRFEAKDAAPNQAVLEIQADELVTMTALPFRLSLKDAAGKSLTGAKIGCDLTMPSMSMPENRPKVVERDGAYVGEMVLTCTMGTWRATCTADTGQGVSQTLTFDLGTARMK